MRSLEQHRTLLLPKCGKNVKVSQLKFELYEVKEVVGMCGGQRPTLVGRVYPYCVSSMIGTQSSGLASARANFLSA